METSSDIGLDLADDDTPTRHSSKLSLGSSPSVLSGDEEDHDIDDDDGLSQDDQRPGVNDETEFLNNSDAKDNDDKHAPSLTEKILEEDPHDTTTTPAIVEKDADNAPHHDNEGHNEEDDDNDEMDDLFNGPLLPSTGDLDDLAMDQDSASPLSSVPDDFPLSRSVSPGSQDGDRDDPLLLLSPLPLQQQQQEEPEQHTSSSPPAVQEEEQQQQASILNGSRKRKGQSSGDEGNDTNGDSPALSEHDPDTTLSNKSRRLSMAGRVLYSRLANETGDVHTEEDDTQVNGGDNDDGNEKEEHNQDGQDDREHTPSSPLMTEQQPRHSNGDKVESPLPPPPPPPPPDLATTLTDVSWDGTTVEDKTPASSSSTHDEDQDSRQRHKEALETLTHIEIEFARLRDKMYEEKMAELNEEAIKIANGTHPELVTLMTEIEEKKHRRIRTAEAWRKYQHGNFQRQFEGAEYQANVQFISKKAALRRDLLSTTNGKRWRLEDEQNKLNDLLQKPEKLIPDALTLRMQKQTKRDEAMELQDIKDAIGFPRAPQVPGSSQQDIKDDLLLLGLGPSGGSR